MRDRTTPGARALAVGVGLLVLLALVAVASRGGLGGGAATGGTPSQTLLSYVFSVFIVIFFAAAPFALWQFVVRRREESELQKTKGGRGARLIANMLVFLLFLGAAFGIQRLRHEHAKPAQITPGIGKAGGGETRAGRRQSAEPTFRWPVLAVAAAIAAAAVAAYLVARSRRPPARKPRAAGELVLALDDAIDDVGAEANPRRAVIKAYARMEAVLAAHGLPRHEAEAPYEYLARALGELDASAASVERLTELFERARFSTHEIDTAMRGEAIGALAAVRDEVRAAA